MPFTVSDAERQELLVTYAALILNEEKITVSAENISKLIKAAGGEVEPYWPKLFATLLESRDISSLLLSSGGGSSGAAASSGTAGAGGAAPAAAAKEEEKPKEKEKSEESEADMGFSLFD